MARILILDTRTRWHVTLPDDVRQDDALTYAWKKVLKLAQKVSSVKSSEVSVQITIPFAMRERLLTEPEKEQEKSAKNS